MKSSPQPGRGKRYIGWVAGILGFAVMSWGYSNYRYPFNILLIIAGAFILAVAVIYSFSGGRRRGRAKGQDTNDGVTQVKTGSTVQGGSDYGQGSMHLDSHANRQGSTKNDGSNYGNEQGFNAGKR